MVDIINMILGYSYDSITYANVEKYFEQERDEANNVEYKSYNQSEGFDKNIQNLYPSICAFLNSDGGIIIWGSPRTTKEGKRRICKGEMMPVNISLEKDDILRRIVSNISPMPSGIRIKPLGKGTNTVFIIEIQTSEYRPHQVDGRYHMRVDANTIPAPHHYVEALFRRIRYPDLRGTITFDSFSFKADRIQHGFTYRINIKVVIENNSPLQNEEFLKYVISCDNGTPIYYTDRWPLPEVSALSTVRPQDPPMQILHHGQKHTKLYAIGLKHDDVFSEGFKIKVILQFGGRYSPLKYCLYELDLSVFEDLLQHVEDQKYPFPSNCIKSNENAQMVDIDFNIEDIERWQAIEY